MGVGDVEFVAGDLVVDRPPNELAIAFSRILDDQEIRHVFVAGDVALRRPDGPEPTASAAIHAGPDPF